ncbi:Laminin Subunit Alpha-5 [Manis pentadactyla]|nr:Laminin Subunit Alpha-5 [Manis pentadactyla]
MATYSDDSASRDRMLIALDDHGRRGSLATFFLPLKEKIHQKVWIPGFTFSIKYTLGYFLSHILSHKSRCTGDYALPRVKKFAPLSNNHPETLGCTVCDLAAVRKAAFPLAGGGHSFLFKDKNCFCLCYPLQCTRLHCEAQPDLCNKFAWEAKTEKREKNKTGNNQAE